MYSAPDVKILVSLANAAGASGETTPITAPTWDKELPSDEFPDNY